MKNVSVWCGLPDRCGGLILILSYQNDKSKWVGLCCVDGGFPPGAWPLFFLYFFKDRVYVSVLRALEAGCFSILEGLVCPEGIGTELAIYCYLYYTV